MDLGWCWHQCCKSQSHTDCHNCTLQMAGCSTVRRYPTLCCQLTGNSPATAATCNLTPQSISSQLATVHHSKSPPKWKNPPNTRKKPSSATMRTNKNYILLQGQQKSERHCNKLIKTESTKRNRRIISKKQQKRQHCTKPRQKMVRKEELKKCKENNEKYQFKKITRKINTKHNSKVSGWLVMQIVSKELAKQSFLKIWLVWGVSSNVSLYLLPVLEALIEM